MKKPPPGPARTAAWLVAMLVLGGGGTYLALRAPPEIVSPVPSASSSGILSTSEWDERLKRQPCDRPAFSAVTHALMKQNDSRAVIARSDAFFAKCGENLDVHSMKFQAYRQLGDWDAAWPESTKLIELAPAVGTYSAWRAQAETAKGDLEAAAADQQQALALDPRIAEAEVGLADLDEKLHRPCDAILPLSLVVTFHARDRADIADVRSRIERLYSDTTCADYASTGQASITFETGQNAHTEATLNGKVKVKMLVDTGAELVTITPKMAKDLGIDVTKLPTARIPAATGFVEAHRARLDQIAVQGAIAKNVEIFIGEDPASEEGLLGQSFLSRFTSTFEGKAGHLDLAGRK